ASTFIEIARMMFIDRNLNPKKIKKTPKNGCLFNTACVP
ncbi:DNA modification methylase, partial [Escherichia coli]|nr:DNA modification methylase [Escherichia coli]